MADPELQEWSTLARSITPQDRERHTPGPYVWNNVEAIVAEDAGVEPPLEEQPPPPDETTKGLGLTYASPPANDVVPPENIIDASAPRETFAPAARRQKRRHLILASAASLLAIVLVVSLITRDSPDPIETYVADVTNNELAEPFDGSAVATIELDDDPRLEVDFDGTLPSDEPLELWLLSTDDSGEVLDARSLGPVQSNATAWSGDWPTGLDLNEFSIVNLSIEPDDGDPTHSGRSILQGELTQS